MEPQVNKDKKKKLKKSYIKLLVLVFFLILIITFAIINSGSDYEDDYVSEYKVEQPIEEQNGTLIDDWATNFTSEIVKILPWSGAVIIIMILNQVINLLKSTY